MGGWGTYIQTRRRRRRGGGQLRGAGVSDVRIFIGYKIDDARDSWLRVSLIHALPLVVRSSTAALHK